MALANSTPEPGDYYRPSDAASNNDGCAASAVKGVRSSRSSSISRKISSTVSGSRVGRKLSRSLSRSRRSESKGERKSESTRYTEGSDALVLASGPEMQQESVAAGESVGGSVGESVGEGYLDLTVLEKYPHAFDLLPSAEVVTMDDEQLAALPVELMRTYHFYTASQTEQTEWIDAFATACRGGDDTNEDGSAAVGAAVDAAVGAATSLSDSISQEATNVPATSRSEETTPSEAAPTPALTAHFAASTPSNMRQFV
jgi:hypothetical protein